MKKCFYLLTRMNLITFRFLTMTRGTPEPHSWCVRSMPSGNDNQQKVNTTSIIRMPVSCGATPPQNRPEEMFKHRVNIKRKSSKLEGDISSSFGFMMDDLLAELQPPNQPFHDGFIFIRCFHVLAVNALHKARLMIRYGKYQLN